MQVISLSLSHTHTKKKKEEGIQLYSVLVAPLATDVPPFFQ